MSSSAGLTAQFCIFCTVSFLVQGGTVKVTPIQKVVTILKDLSSKIEAEGKKEAAEYDKFSCFCKEQADEKQYAMEKSDSTITDLTAEIAVLSNDLGKLNSQVSTLNEDIEHLKEVIEEKTHIRSVDHEEYLHEAQDMNEAIHACDAAIETLKTSKSEMRGAKLDLVQVTSGLVKVVKRQSKLATTHGAVDLLSKIEEQGAPKFEYHSNDIIATMEDLLSTFKSMKKDLDLDEFNIQSAHDSTILGLSNQKTFKTKAKEEKEKIAQSKEEEKADKMGQRKDESDDRDADKEFMKQLQDECEHKAFLFDQRSQVRMGELTALKKATDELATGAVPNFKGNTKLVGLQTSTAGHGGKIRGEKMMSSPVALVQISEVVQHEVSEREGGLERVQSFLAQTAQRTGSSALQALSIRVGVASRKNVLSSGRMDQSVPPATTDHFVLVRRLINNLLDKLQGDEESEATQKSNCDEGIKKATAERDAANANMEHATAHLSTLDGNKNKLEAFNEYLTSQIAKLKKAILESAEVTAEQIQNLNDQIRMCEEGRDSVDFALTTLERFYHDDAFSLVQTKYRPKGADREGKTLGDLEPATFDSTYHGAQAESEGIIGILEVIRSDFARSLDQATSDRDDAKLMGETFEKETNADIARKNTLVDKNDKLLAEVNGDLLEQEAALRDAKGDLKSAKKALDGWHSMCVEGEETWEERKQKREEEIEALKEALTILEEWQD